MEEMKECKALNLIPQFSPIYNFLAIFYRLFLVHDSQKVINIMVVRSCTTRRRGSRICQSQPSSSEEASSTMAELGDNEEENSGSDLKIRYKAGC